MLVLLFRHWWCFRVTFVIQPSLHPAVVPLLSFFLYGNHAPLDLILLCSSDRAGQHLVTLLNQDVVDLAVLAPDVVGQEVPGLEGEATEETLEAVHQVGVLRFNRLVEVAGTVAVQCVQRFGLSFANFAF